MVLTVGLSEGLEDSVQALELDVNSEVLVWMYVISGIKIFIEASIGFFLVLIEC